MRAGFPVLLALISIAIAGCGARTGLSDRLDAAAIPGRDGGIDGGRDGDGGRDAAIDAPFDAPGDGGQDGGIDAGCVPSSDGCGMIEICSNGVDDDCDGRPDDGCACEAGSVQGCFEGPPGRRDVGVCSDGTQTCEMSGTWGPCAGGIGPQPDVCDGRDNLCDGCSARRDCPIDCPSPGDPRVTDGAPFADYLLRGADFYRGMARSWRWSIEGGPCDQLATRLESFELRDAASETATFVPRLSGDYTVTLTVVTVEGTRLTCSWNVHVAGPGLRIEMCYPESETQDLDLFLHRPGTTTPWYPRGGDSFDATPDACGWHNCLPMLRGGGGARADWGYEPSALSECENGPQGEAWRAIGRCPNPRLDIDNNLSTPEATGLPENINVDAPREGETFRVMVQNFSGTIARPVVNVYCDGRRVGTYGAAPDTVPRYTGRRGDETVGAMWRVVDVTTHVDATGAVTCDLAAVHPPGTMSGYDVTYNDPRF